MSLRSSLGPYQLVRTIGRGGMGEVHLAIAHGASGFSRTVAIKTLVPELADDADLTRALIREATIAGALHHRNLVAVLGLGVDDGIYYVVMEYVDGGDLARYLPLPEPLALHVVHEAALGLAFLHAARDDHGLPLGIVHRDVSPSNLLVSSTGDVKLADFGIAKATALADLTAAGTRKGTYAYMAPEQLAGEPVAQSSDQFGLAVTLAELVTGRRPFTGDTPWATMEAIRTGAADLDGLAADVAELVRRALAIDPAARFASIDELRRALAVIQRSRPPVGPIELGAMIVRLRQ
ncbi:MAG TPA: serine/threonine-protein kinase [Kofleriaceae bacterium]|jgi:serine/threonine-protein kinase|nr:serine/threonine-protein kinase [Kofleriaceae bacterium]